MYKSWDLVDLIFKFHNESQPVHYFFANLKAWHNDIFRNNPF